MKQTSKATRKEPPKGDSSTTIRKIESYGASIGDSTPEISARTRQSLEEHTADKQDDKDKQIEMMNEHFTQQQKELEELKEALTYSQEQRQATSVAYMEISQKLTNSIPIIPGPNINKPRIPRPQDNTAYQEIMNAKEKDEEEGESATEHNDILKLFSNLVNALKDTSKADVNLPPKFYGDDDKWEGWYKQWRAYLQVPAGERMANNCRSSRRTWSNRL
jgi:hypothetical protein